MDEKLQAKVNKAIATLKAFDNADEPYYLCYSGGKDSDCIRLLADLAGVNYELHNNHTTVDTPTTVRYIREVMSKYGEKTFLINEDGTRTTKYGERGFVHYPKYTMWQLIVKEKYPPTRLFRYCCEQLKEYGGKGRRKVTGVRWAESAKRRANQGLVTIVGKPKGTQKVASSMGAEFNVNKQGGLVLNTDNDPARRTVEMCYRTTSTLINPIIDWEDEDVWDFLHSQGCESNPEYKNGYKRIGCIGCPLASDKNQKAELDRHPKYKQIYIDTFDRMLKAKGGDPKGMWRTGEDVMKWWIGEDPTAISMEDYMKELEEGEKK